MKNTINGYPSIDAYVSAKLARADTLEHTFLNLFDMMFSERSNILYERSAGYRIERTTYGESHDRILIKANTLRTLLADVPADAVIGLHMDNSLYWIETFWAIIRAGFRPLLLNKRLSDEVLERALADVGAKAVISDGTAFSLPTLSYTALDADGSPIASDECGSELFVMSSGTSSHVKLCAYGAEEFFVQVHDSADIIRECAQMKKMYKGEMKLLTFLPFYHIFGLVAVYIWFGFFSRTFVELHDLSPNTITGTIRRHKVTHIFAVPLFWNKVYEQAMSTIHKQNAAAKFEKGMRIAHLLEAFPPLFRGFTRLAFREVRDNMFGESIRFLISGGAEVRPEVMRFFNSIGYHLANGYGMTEIGIAAVDLSLNKAELMKGSIGKPITSMHFSIGEGGAFTVRGDACARYLLENGVKKDIRSGYNTGDLAKCVRGKYYILGRNDDVVISPNGENLNPNLVEDAVRGIRDTTDICLIGAKKDGRITPTLLIGVEKYISDDAYDTIRGTVKEKLAKAGLERQIASVIFTARPLMLDAEFKLNRRAVTERFEAGFYVPFSTAAGSTELPKGELADRIRAIFAASLGKTADEIGDTLDFFGDLGGTSLDYFAMLPRLNEEFGVSIPVAEGGSYTTVAALYSFIKDALGL